MRNRKPLIFRELRRAIKDDSVGYERTLVELIRDAVTFPFRFLTAFLQFMAVAWPTSRNSYAFVRGLPALIVIGLFGIGVWASYYFVNLNKLVKRSQAKIEFFRINAPDNPEYAEIFAKRFIELRPEDNEAKFQLAVCYENNGKEYLSEQLFDYLVAHEDTNHNGELDPGEDLNGDGELNLGYGKAHVRVGQKYLQADGNDYENLPEEERLKRAAEHFNLALKTEDDDSQLFALAFLAEVNDRMGDRKAAIENLNAMLSVRMNSLLQIRAIPRRLKLQLDQLAEEKAALVSLDEEERRSTAKRLDRMRRSVEVTTRNVIDDSRIMAKRADLIEIWRTLIQCAELIEDFELAFELIQFGADETSSDEMRSRLIMLRSQVYLAKADSIGGLDQRDKFQAHYNAVLMAIKSNSANLASYRRVWEILQEASAEQRAWIREMQLNSRASEVIEVILGLMEIQNSDFETAKGHWRTALGKSELSPLIITNFIEAKLNSDPAAKSQLSNMFALASELFPDFPRLLLAEGIFRLRENKVDEALQLLEAAVIKMADFLPARLALMEAYRLSGDEDNRAVQELEYERIMQSYSLAEQARLRKVYSRSYIFPEEQ